jgi:hypothetical protein
VERQEHDFAQGVTPYLAVRLCPALRPEIQEKEIENRAIPTQISNNFSEHLKGDRAKFTTQLAEITRLGGDMFLADPPLKEVEVHLRHTHTDSDFAVSVTTTVRQESLLTLGGMIKAAKQAKESLWLKEEVLKEPRFWCRCRWTRCCDFHRETSPRVLHNSSLQSVVTAHTKANGGSFVLDIAQSWVDPQAVIPTEEEWKKMYEVRSEEEARKKQQVINDPSAQMGQMRDLDDLEEWEADGETFLAVTSIYGPRG